MAMFSRPSENSSSDIERLYQKLMCLDESFELKGNFNTASGKQLMLVFEVCRDPPGSTEHKCKDYETVIKPWLRRKFLFTLENRQVFKKE